MSVFVLMTKLGPEAVRDAHGRRAMGREWLHKVRVVCPEVQWLAHYALLGPYDFMDIYEAPDVETAQRVSIVSRSEGALTAESWPAVEYEKFLEELGRIQP